MFSAIVENKCYNMGEFIVKKILSLLMATVMLLSTMSACVTLVSAETVSATEEIFTETFEDYTKDVNWLDNISDRHVTGVVPEGKEKDWFIYDGTVGASSNKTKIYHGAPDAEIMVVDAGALGLESDGVDRGQVLKIYGGAGEDDECAGRPDSYGTSGRRSSRCGPSALHPLTGRLGLS